MTDQMIIRQGEVKEMSTSHRQPSHTVTNTCFYWLRVFVETVVSECSGSGRVGERRWGMAVVEEVLP